MANSTALSPGGALARALDDLYDAGGLQGSTLGSRRQLADQIVDGLEGYGFIIVQAPVRGGCPHA